MAGQVISKKSRRYRARMLSAFALASASTCRKGAAFSIRPATHSGVSQHKLSTLSSQRNFQKNRVTLSRFNQLDIICGQKLGIERTTSRWMSAISPDPVLSEVKHVDNKYDVTNKEKGIVGKYEPSLFESDIYKWWEDAGCFQPDAKQSQEKSKANGREPYVLPMPPPNVTGRLHMGHAIFVALQDVLARFHRMRGRPVLWLPGRCSLIFFYISSTLRFKIDNFWSIYM